jgi:flagellar hook assembly protein FlgD
VNSPDGLIEFSLENSSHVRVDVYDVGGRMVATLADGVVAAGVHHFRWDGRGFPSGIYYYNVRGPDFLKSGKIEVPAL